MQQRLCPCTTYIKADKMLALVALKNAIVFSSASHGLEWFGGRTFKKNIMIELLGFRIGRVLQICTAVRYKAEMSWYSEQDYLK